MLRVKDQGWTKDEPKNDLRIANWKKCFLLRLASLLPFLYLLLFYRENSERRPKELRKKTIWLKKHFSYDWVLKRLTGFPKKLYPFLKKVDSFPETVDLYSSPLHLTLYTLHQKNRTKMRFFLHIRKFYCTFAPWTCAEGCLTSLAEGSRHIKKAFISALFWPFGISQISSIFRT